MKGGQSNSEFAGTTSSCEEIQRGLIYTSAYYEEEQLYNEIIDNCRTTSDAIKVSCNLQRTAPCVNPPVEIDDNSTTNIDLPPILWHGYKSVPKILSLTNTGRTILINGQWVNGRPYIEGGPLNGTYIFSQIHFHSPSEHEIQGKRFPLEMHVVHYKTCYLTQERAMREKDGTVVLVYLFKFWDTTKTDLSNVTKLASKIGKVDSRAEATDISLDHIVKPFSSNYYVYWGSVETVKNSYLLQWIVNGSVLNVTKQEADELLGIMNFCEINDKNVPRMIPENGAIYYVEEIESVIEAEKDKSQQGVGICQNCRSYLEYQFLYGAQICQNTCDVHSSKDTCSAQNRNCVCKRDEENLSFANQVKKYLTNNKKQLSGLRICCQKMKNPIRSRSQSQTQSVCSCHTVCVPSVSPGKGETVVVAQETTSCPSVTAATETAQCEQKPESEEQEIKIKIVSSCPSVKKEGSSSNDCTSESIKVKMKNKKKSEGKDTCKGSSSHQVSPKKNKPAKKSGQKCANQKADTQKADTQKADTQKADTQKADTQKADTQKADTQKADTQKADTQKADTQKEKDLDKDEPTTKRSSSTKKKSSAKKTKKKCESDSDAEHVKSRTSVTSKSVTIEVQECNKEQEPPVQCVLQISTTPEKSFEEILREYDTTWLEDSKFKMSKTESRFSDELFDNDITSKKSSCNQDDNPITTLYEKKRGSKPSEPAAEDCTVNFLLKPDSRKSNPSSSFISPKSTSEEIKCVENKLSKGVNVPDITVNTVTLSGVRLPTENPNESPKEFCVQVELLFHSNNKDFSECVTQEYNLALMYNQNILQEYRGILCPKNLQIGNYEKLDLVPKYPELDNISIRLQDCTVKMESSDQLCMRAKFLMKELDLKNPDTTGEQECGENATKKITILSDAITQCSVKEFDKSKDFEILEKLSLKAKMSEYRANEPLGSEPAVKRSNSRVNFSTPRSQLSKQSIQQSMNDSVQEDQKCDVQQGHPSKDGQHVYEYMEDGREIFNSSEELNESTKDPTGKKAFKDLRNLFSNRKKTVYFLYEKVEKDQNSGKKIFVGSFRSKDDVKGLSRDKKSHQSFDTDNIKNVNNEEDNALLHSAKCSVSDDQDQNSYEEEMKVHSPSHSKHCENDKKDLVTLHKFKPKHLRVNDNKKERLNLVVGKALNQLQKDSKNFKRLADLVGIDQKENSKISVYELHTSSESEIPKTSAASAEAGKPNVMVVSDVQHSQDSVVVENQKPLSRKISQSAVLIIPVEVESLSKVEVILVEHSENAKKSILKRGKEIIPCLDY